MSNKSRVIQDEKDAEARYVQALEDARNAARAMAADEARKDSARAAAAETDAALDRIESARVKAEAEADGMAAKRTFGQALREWWGGSV